MIDVNDAPYVPNSRDVTDRELALGLLRKPTYRGDYSEIRYMEQDEIVSFGVLNEKSDFNWEFYLNGDRTRRIWFSQLNGFYLFREGNGVYTCMLTLKNTKPESIALLSPVVFWRKVEGRKFKVDINMEMYEIDRWHQKCQDRSVYDIVQEILKALDEERYADVRGMTRPKTLYCLTEV